MRTQITTFGKGNKNLLEHNNVVCTQITTFEKVSQNLLKHTQLSLHLFHGRSSHLIQRGTGRFAALEARRFGRFLGLLGLILLLALLGLLLLVLLGRFVLLGFLLHLFVGLLFLKFHKNENDKYFCHFMTIFLSAGSSKVKALPELRS